MQTFRALSSIAMCSGLLAIGGCTTVAESVSVLNCGDSVHEKWDLRILVKDGAPTGIVLGDSTVDAQKTSICRDDKLNWRTGKTNGFEVRFDKDGQNTAPTVPASTLGLVAEKRWFKGKMIFVVYDRSVRSDAAGEFKYRVCLPDCSSAGHKELDPIIIVED